MNTKSVKNPLWALLAALLTAGCGDDVAGPEQAGIDGYLESLPTWEEFAPLSPRSNEPTGAEPESSSTTIGDTQFNCTSTEYTLTDTPEQVTVFNPDAEVMWLGALLEGQGYVNGLGSLKELPIRQRAPLTIFVDLLSENVTRTVENPDPASVGRAIGELIQQAEEVGHDAGSDIFFLERQTHEFEQAALDLGVSARFLGNEIESELSFEQTVEQNTLTAYFVQQMFTTSMVLPQVPSDVFSNEFTDQAMQAQVDRGRIGPDNLPTFISSIVWGRMLMLTMTSSSSVTEMRAALRASRDAIGSGSIESEHQQVLEESEIRVTSVGGDDEGVADLIRTGSLGNYFASDAALTTARPLSYTVRNLADNSIADVSETTTYNLRECTTSTAQRTGARYKVVIDKIEIVSIGCDDFFDEAFHPSPDVYYSYSLHTDSGTHVIASRSQSNAVTLDAGGVLQIGSAPRFVNLYADGRGSLRITGTAWDYDAGNQDEVIGTWDLSYGWSISNGQRFFTRSGGGCRSRLYLTITKENDLFD